MKKLLILTSTILLASTVAASSGNYSTGVQIGGAPTAAQQAFYDDQERIRNQGEHLHESEHRNGGKLVIKVTKVMWHAARREIRRKHREWFGHPKRHHYYED